MFHGIECDASGTQGAPEPLDAFKDRRIIGIKYDLIQTPEPVGRLIKPEAAEKEKCNRKLQAAEWEPAPDGRARFAAGDSDPENCKDHRRVMSQSPRQKKPTASRRWV